MSEPIISIRGLGKRFHLGEKADHDTLRDHIAAGLKMLIGRGGKRAEKSPEMWALRDVTFDIQEGEVMGIVGHNGAGKSTLLKILSQISEPTEGEARIRGRVASLLEVGTGFHPELTGRENILLNGAILGMSRREVTARFDEIVAFSEVEKFIDTPVKRYSSGMYMRLAFAVAAHLQPEVLMVDEVLAVGDAAFQAKCLGKMNSVAQEGRTVLFVSHNLAAIAQLCSRAVFLKQGRVERVGTPNEVIQNYLSSARGDGSNWSVVSEKIAAQTGPIRITSLELRDLSGTVLDSVSTGHGLIVRIGYHIADGVSIPSASFVVRIKCGWGMELLRMGNTPLSGWPVNDLTGRGTMDLVFPKLHLASGMYYLDAGLARMGQGFYCDLRDVIRLFVEKEDVYGGGHAIDDSRGWCVAPHRWVLRREGAALTDSGWIAPQLLELPPFTP